MILFVYHKSIQFVSYGFGKMVGWQFIAGRDFSRDFATDSAKIIINETAANDMGFKNPIGQFVKFAGGTKSTQIVGVIKDMVMGSPYEPEKRAIFFLDARYQTASLIDIKINDNKLIIFLHLKLFCLVTIVCRKVSTFFFLKR